MTPEPSPLADRSRILRPADRRSGDTAESDGPPDDHGDAAGDTPAGGVFVGHERYHESRSCAGWADDAPVAVPVRVAIREGKTPCGKCRPPGPADVGLQDPVGDGGDADGADPDPGAGARDGDGAGDGAGGRARPDGGRPLRQSCPACGARNPRIVSSGPTGGPNTTLHYECRACPWTGPVERDGSPTAGIAGGDDRERDLRADGGRSRDTPGRRAADADSSRNAAARGEWVVVSRGDGRLGTTPVRLPDPDAAPDYDAMKARAVDRVRGRGPVRSHGPGTLLATIRLDAGTGAIEVEYHVPTTTGRPRGPLAPLRRVRRWLRDRVAARLGAGSEPPDAGGDR